MQFVEVLDIGLRQETVKSLLVEQELFIAHLVVQHLSLVEFYDGGLGEQVIRTGKETQGLNEQADGRGSIEAEGFI